jgi:hypothetical protein
MTSAEYEAVPHRIKVLTWPEASRTDLEALIGAENVNIGDMLHQVRSSDGDWVTLTDGWHVAVTDAGVRIVLAPAAFAAQYRPVT